MPPTDQTPVNPTSVHLDVQLGRLHLANPITVASGTFGYAREMAGLVDMSRLGGIVPKTITQQPRAGNPPPRTVETTGGMLNSIGLDNDGIEAFLGAAVALPGLAEDGRDRQHCREDGRRVRGDGRPAGWHARHRRPGTEHVLPERQRRGRFRHQSGAVRTGGFRRASGVLAADPGQADAQRDRHRRDCPGRRGRRGRRPVADQHLSGHGRQLAAPPAVLGNVLGGLSGPAIKPIALRIVYQVAKAVKIPLVGVGGIATVDDVMEFLVAGATAVQIGTANFYNPKASLQILDALPAALADLGATSVAEVVGTLEE